jgi:hypothetical protein
MTEGFDNSKNMLKDGFRTELNDFSSPEKTRGRITSRNSECKSPGLNSFDFFNKYVPKSRKNSEVLKRKSFGFGGKDMTDVKSEKTDQRMNIPSSGSNS